MNYSWIKAPMVFFCRVEDSIIIQLTELLIPITALLVIGAIVFIIFKYKKSIALKMIEKGMNPKDDGLSQFKKSTFFK